MRFLQFFTSSKCILPNIPFTPSPIFNVVLAGDLDRWLETTLKMGGGGLQVKHLYQFWQKWSKNCKKSHVFRPLVSECDPFWCLWYIPHIWLKLLPLCYEDSMLLEFKNPGNSTFSYKKCRSQPNFMKKCHFGVFCTWNRVKNAGKLPFWRAIVQSK